MLTEKLSEKLFGDEVAIGKTLKVNGEREVIVTGIAKNVPHNSHMQFDYIMPMSRRLIEVPSLKDAWGNNSLYTYVQLAAGASPAGFDGKIQRYLKTKLEASVTDLFLQPITDIHLSELSFAADAGHNGNMKYVTIFSIIAIFILVIACINFMNLATARGINRAKEVGLRKTIGAYRYQLIFQFLGESVMVALVALGIALLIVDLLLSPFNDLTQKSLAIDFTNFYSGILPVCLLATIFTGLLAGSYPAVFLSSFQPAHVLKGTTHRPAGGMLRKVLVVVQFSISIIMISGTIVIYSQMKYIREINLGWDHDNVVLVPNVQRYHTLKERLKSHSQIQGVSASNQHPNYVQNSTSGIGWRGKPEDEVMLFHLEGVDYDYIETMKIEMLMGRSFSKSSLGDTLSTLINEEAMKVLGFENPVGEYLTAGD
ncbi:MAG TPA: ABC transporter permease, partial [Cyclobacteriaceae bacterium]|nr:ABC transporter permease [Cyclobacteriaceae bacterium]